MIGIKKMAMMLLVLSTASWAMAQKTTSYDLVKILEEHRLLMTPGLQMKMSDSTDKHAVAIKGVAWLRGINFTEGRIDIDLRGRNVFLQSFIGIAFHGVDTAHYELVYFRPFNFRHEDTLRRNWSVQYMRVPDFLYDKLRKEHPLVYENAVIPVPDPADWFHASIVIKDDWITVYVNHSTQASLHVKKLGNINTGKIALWDDPDGLAGDFADLILAQ
jgi:hypothetical protein